MSLGPRITNKESCFDCEYCHNDRYQVQGDSGCDVTCSHPEAPTDNYVGDTRWTTPLWCPARK